MVGARSGAWSHGGVAAPAGGRAKRQQQGGHGAMGHGSETVAPVRRDVNVKIDNTLPRTGASCILTLLELAHSHRGLAHSMEMTFLASFTPGMRQP